MFRNDYLIRQIEVMVKYIAETVLGKKDKNYNITTEKNFENDNMGDDITYLYKLVDDGKINLAENILFEKIENNHSYDLLETGLDFYIYLNNKSDEFLEENNFSRQEIADGLEDLQRIFGLLWYNNYERCD